jgi:hypothetical protein
MDRRRDAFEKKQIVGWHALIPQPTCELLPRT